MDRINSGEMPPTKEPRPKAEEVARVAEWIAAQLTEAEAARQAATGEKVSFRRLSREEYRNTIRDLLGVTYDAERPHRPARRPRLAGLRAHRRRCSRSRRRTSRSTSRRRRRS